jgi:hypothetical protein
MKTKPCSFSITVFLPAFRKWALSPTTVKRQKIHAIYYVAYINTMIWEDLRNAHRGPRGSGTLTKIPRDP